MSLTTPVRGAAGGPGGYSDEVNAELDAVLAGDPRVSGAVAYADNVSAIAGTESGDALNSAMSDAMDAGVPMIMRGVFNSASMFEVIGALEATHSTIVATGDGSTPAGRISIPGADPSQGRTVRLPRLVRPTPLWTPNHHAGDVGWSIRYGIGNHIYVPFIQGFSTARLWDPQSADYACADNLVFDGYFLDNLISEDVAPGSGGYCNHNQVFGGIHALTLSHGRRVPGSRFLRCSVSGYQVNGITWYGPEFQGSAAEAMWETWSENCRLVNPEIEQTNGNWVISDAVISGGTTITLSDADVAAGMAFNRTVDGGAAISGAGIPAGTTLVAGGFGTPNANGYSKTATLSQACTNGSVVATVQEVAVVMWRSSGGNTARYNKIELPTGGSYPFINEIRDAGVSVADNRVESLAFGKTITESGLYDYYGHEGYSHWESESIGYGTGTPQKGVNIVPGLDTDAGAPLEASLGAEVHDGTHNRRVKLFVDEDHGIVGLLATYSSGVPKFVIAIAGDEFFRIDPSANKLSIGKSGQALAFLGATGAVRATIAGSRGSATASVLGQLLAALSVASGMGLVTDSTTA